MPPKTSSTTQYDAAVRKAMKQYDIKSVADFHGARGHELPDEPGKNSNTTGGNKSRGSSRGRGAKSGASSREPSSERGPIGLKECARAKNTLAVRQYKFEKDTIGMFSRKDLMATAIMLCETNKDSTVMEYMRLHGATKDDKYFTMVDTLFKNFNDGQWNYDVMTDKARFKFHIDNAMYEFRKANINYRDMMSKATMAALVINKLHAKTEAEKKMTFMQYIEHHKTPDDASVAMEKTIFKYPHDNMRAPGHSAPSTGLAPHTPALPRREGGRGPPLVHPVGSDGFGSSFDTQHFGEAVPDEYRV